MQLMRKLWTQVCAVRVRYSHLQLKMLWSRYERWHIFHIRSNIFWVLRLFVPTRLRSHSTLESGTQRAIKSQMHRRNGGNSRAHSKILNVLEKHDATHDGAYIWSAFVQSDGILFLNSSVKKFGTFWHAYAWQWHAIYRSLPAIRQTS